MLKYILVEHGDGPRHAHNHQWLAGQHRKHHGAEDRRKQHLVDAVLHSCLVEHVEREGQRRQDATRNQERVVSPGRN